MDRTGRRVPAVWTLAAGTLINLEEPMKRYLVSTAAIVTLTLALTFPVAVPAAPPTPQPNPAAAPAAKPVPPHPEIQNALEALRVAREHLNHAAHDFGGHRVEAIRSIDEAINQLKVCMRYEK